MYCTSKINQDLIYIGVSDRRLELFENAYPIPRGISYNSYLLKDEKTALIDTVDHSVSRQFLCNLDYALEGANLDYLIVNHMEPDHCATMDTVIRSHPEVKIVTNSKVANMIKQFFDFDIDSRLILVKEDETFSTGKHSFKFFMAPMVHWPEVMVTFDTSDGTLYSADAFGTFGALNGNIFADEVDFERDWLDDARRYYTNIVGKYGLPVQRLLEKASNLAIKTICPLHGPIWRKDFGDFIEKYKQWSSYTPEIKSVLLVYASIYGNTENAVSILARKLAEQGVRNIAIHDVSKSDVSEVLSDSFKYSHIVFASPTYNGGIFSKMEDLLHEIKNHNLQNRTIAFIQNGSWAPTSAKQMQELLGERFTIIEPTVTITSSIKESNLVELSELANNIVKSL